METLDDLLALIKSFILGEWPTKPAPKDFQGKQISWQNLHKENKQANFVAELILDFCNAIKNKADRITIQRAIINIFNESRLSKDQHQRERVQQIKLALKGKKGLNWRSELIDVDYVIEYRDFFQNLTYDNSAKLDVCYDKTRFKQFTSKNKINVLTGSTFVTDQKNLLAQNSHILDAFYCVTASNQRTIFAIADGLGGHVVDIHQDRMIARAAHFASKHAVRLFAAYSSPDALKADMPKIILDLEKEVQLKSKGESTTLLCCQMFYQQNTSDYRIVGFNIGDNTLMSWHPETKQFKMIAKIWRSNHGTAQFPVSYKSFEIQYIDEVMPVGTILFPMTDGVADDLPQQCVVKIYPNELKYDEISLDTTYMEDILKDVPLNADLHIYIDIILRNVIKNINAKKHQQLTKSEMIRMGDDTLLAVIPMNKPSLFENVKMFFHKDKQKHDDTKLDDDNKDNTHPKQAVRK